MVALSEFDSVVIAARAAKQLIAMALSNESEIIDLGKNPIAGGDPCGVDAGDDEDYMFAINEVAKIGRIEADEPDWYKMEQACTKKISIGL